MLYVRRFAFAALLLLLLGGTASASLYGESSLNHSCVLENPVWSCSPQASPSHVDTCCAETYGGLLLSTQFWDTYTGLESESQLLPERSWTLHGLWPDFCNGSYPQWCDSNRQYTGAEITSFLTNFGKYDLLTWMKKYWINQGGPSSALWAHEFSKHATCYSTFDAPCYGPESVPHSDVLDYINAVIYYYRQHPTYQWLSDAHIYPSNSTTYTLSEIQGALKQSSGATPYLGCTGPLFNETKAGKGSTDNGAIYLDEVWYYLYVYGRPQDRIFVPVDASNGGSTTTCAKSEGAIWYLERTKASEAP